MGVLKGKIGEWVMLSIDMQFMLDEEKLTLLTRRPSGLTPWQIW